MITHLVFSTPNGVALQVPFGVGAVSSPVLGLWIKDIEGLGPVQAGISLSTFSTMDGGLFESARVPERNIVFTMGFDPDFAASSDPYGETRRALYRWFWPKVAVQVAIYSDNHPRVNTVGYVESVEPMLFSKDPELRISIVCPDPYFSANEDVKVGRAGVGQLIIENPGTVPVGFWALISNYARYTGTGSIYLFRSGFPQERMDITGPVTDGTGVRLAVLVNSLRGQKSVAWKRQSAYSPATPLSSFGGTSIIGQAKGWVELYPGTNYLTMNQTSASAFTTELKLDVQFRPKYVGL